MEDAVMHHLQGIIQMEIVPKCPHLEIKLFIYWGRIYVWTQTPFGINRPLGSVQEVCFIIMLYDCDFPQLKTVGRDINIVLYFQFMVVREWVTAIILEIWNGGLMWLCLCNIMHCFSLWMYELECSVENGFLIM